ncbi:GtrA family protein [Breoghania sp. L-A4]|nr:GtrA family protein [Breoghania sp. L-A4]
MFTAWRFGIVGLAATATHAGIALALTVSGLAHPLVANLIAFLVAFAVSFLGHHVWSFPDSASTARRRRRRMMRFFALAFAGFAANSAALAGWLAWVPLPDALGVIVSIGLIPLVTYLGARMWAFAEPAV